MLADAPLKREALAEWGAWLSRTWDWSWWVTLTFDPKRKPSSGSDGSHTAVGWSLSSKYWDEWLRAAVGDSSGATPWDGSTYWLRGREKNPNRYGTHFHALVGGVPTDTSRRRAWELWADRHGMARIEPYNPNRGAGWYVSKYVVKELGDLTFSPNLGHFKKEETTE